ncbi:hypothetical protein [Rubrivivax rivuli]|uniref:Uncharacterized protein n=1 Tax=Rubrivivax rivuli TaxID=1862385 RepID=A0A437RRW5_9BURK|nr:hypothetical protein [Rubrivivax rivuli]RVU49523.1 hypothetical protein EOE66_02850 [Rubrivivax rivuli]
MNAPLAKLKFLACQDIDRKAGEVRLKFISAASGQQRVYERKRAEAAALVADPQSMPGNFLFAEAQRTGRSAMEVAQAILAAVCREDLAAPFIEAERVGGKRDVRLANSPEAVAAALASSLAALEAATD